MIQPSTRNSPKGPSNQELFLWALFLLGGADHDVEVEEIYLKCFDIAPSRLAWRTRPDLPDYKKTAKALQSVEAQTDYIYRPHRYARRLSPQGITWITANETMLRNLYSDSMVPPPLTNQYVQQARRLRHQPIWERFESNSYDDVLNLLASALECSPASPDSVWRGRFTELSRMGDVLHDQELLDFEKYAEAIYLASKDSR
jgi:hypothetical protein